MDWSQIMINNFIVSCVPHIVVLVFLQLNVSLVRVLQIKFIQESWMICVSVLRDISVISQLNKIAEVKLFKY